MIDFKQFVLLLTPEQEYLLRCWPIPVFIWSLGSTVEKHYLSNPSVDICSHNKFDQSSFIVLVYKALYRRQADIALKTTEDVNVCEKLYIDLLTNRIHFSIIRICEKVKCPKYIGKKEKSFIYWGEDVTKQINKYYRLI